jgi:hypothetical protein
MVKRGTSEPPAGQPSIPAAEGVRLLTELVDRAKALLQEREVTEHAYRNWRIATRQVLVEALGEGQQMMQMASAAGAPRRVITEDTDVEELHRESLSAGASALEPCIEHLRRQAQRDAEKAYADSNSGDEQPFVTFDTAQICFNGHIINDAARAVPADSKPFCPKCGTATITTCPACAAAIQGTRRDGSSSHGLYSPHAHCHSCGAAFPWTAARLRALSELLAMTDASLEDQAALRDTFPALAAESPGTPIAVLKWKRFLAGAGKVVAESARDLLVDIMAEAVKRKMFPPG